MIDFIPQKLMYNGLVAFLCYLFDLQAKIFEEMNSSFQNGRLFQMLKFSPTQVLWPF